MSDLTFNIDGNIRTSVITDNTDASTENRTYEEYTLGDSASAQDITDLEADKLNRVRYQSFYVPANAMTPRDTNGASKGTTEHPTNDIMLDTLDFDKDTSEGAQFTQQMPDDWDLGTVKCKFVWTASAGSVSNTVQWALAGRAFSDNDAIDQAFGSPATKGDALIALDDIHTTTATVSITLAGTPLLGDKCIFEVTRNIADNLLADACLIGIHIQYKTLSTVTAQW